MRVEDMPLVRLCADAAWEELDRQHLDGDAKVYVDTVQGYVEGTPNMEELVSAILECLWEEEGR